VPPEIDVAGKLARVTLYGRVAAGRTALVDAADAELVAPFRWRVRERKGGRSSYAVAWRSARPYAEVMMHSLITGWPLTDHRNHNGLDNRRANLRDATVRQNTHNTRPRLGSTSQYKGVSRASDCNRWLAQIYIGGRKTYLGIFVIEEDAARAYDAAARGEFGEFAYLNFPEDGQPAPSLASDGVALAAGVLF
jgi:AP2 domain